MLFFRGNRSIPEYPGVSRSIPEYPETTNDLSQVKLANFITYRVHLYTRGSRTDNYRIGIHVCTNVNQTRGSYEPVVAHLDFNLT